MINAGNAAGREPPVYSLVIPGFNAEAALPLLVRRDEPNSTSSTPALEQRFPIAGIAA
ncbi:hypothetical protein LB523_29085 [Mesorhizobium sp. ESP-6-4]|uniref:hypothetical protein n=1 Tax=Mesorhizobium sp. ESP-6-4 TaxID=2876624 RepID=UPI001CCD9D3D|nr:hypothetical protein [Mesorhizobium sp. ESP-6-4]MBZ9663107.1 hypothetical protein [Mesorhizobium sp. ESP-6-4]